MAEKTEREALKELTKDIEKLAPMAHHQLRSDFSNRMFLETTVQEKQ